MRDYRLPRNHRRPRSTSVLRSSRKILRPSNQEESGWSRLKTAGILTVISMCLLALTGYGLLSQIVPRLFPLEQSTNLMLVASKNYKTPSEIVLLHFRPQQQRLIVTKLKAEESVKVIGGFGEYPLRSLGPLMDLEKKDSSFQRAAFSYSVGELIQGGAEAPDSLWSANPNQLKEEITVALRQQRWGSLPVSEQMALFFFTAHLPDDNVEIRQVDSLERWAEVRSQLSLQYPVSECPVAVINTTSLAGLASTISQVIEQTGYPVIRVTDSNANLPATRIFYASEPEACAEHAAAIAAVIPFEVEITPDTALTQRYRANIVVELGQDVSAVAP